MAIGPGQSNCEGVEIRKVKPGGSDAGALPYLQYARCGCEVRGGLPPVGSRPYDKWATGTWEPAAFDPYGDTA